MAITVTNPFPGTTRYTCDECDERSQLQELGVRKLAGAMPVIKHDPKCSHYVPPTPKNLPHELAEEDYRLARNSEGNSDTL